MKVSKVVLIVVALHVLVIGGIFVFEGCSRSKSTPALAGDESAPPTTDTAALPATNQPEVATVPPTATTPVTPAVTETPVAPAATTYVVKKNDTLQKIAKSQGVALAELCKANNVTKSSALRIGQKLTIPAKAIAVAAATVPAPATVATAATTGSADAGGTVYAVKSGDSLWKIANKNGVTVAALKKANSLTSDTLKVGQKLHIPAAAAASAAGATGAATGAGMTVSTGAGDFREPGTYKENGQTLHVVDANETLAVIAKKYGVKVDDLKKANSITNDKSIQYGQKLVIPVAAAPVVTASAATTVSTTAAVAPVVSSPLAGGPVTIH